MMNKEEYIKLLNLSPHQEGGYFIQTYLSDDKIGGSSLFSSIIFMLCENEVSHFHRLQEDELWYYHDGESLDVVEINPEGKLVITTLGKNIDKGEKLQGLVKKGTIFGSIMKNPGFSLVGCMVSPSFDYNHFELFTKEELIKEYPEYIDVINILGK